MLRNAAATVRLLSEILADRQTRNERTLAQMSERDAQVAQESLAQRLQARILSFFGLKIRAVGA